MLIYYYHRTSTRAELKITKENTADYTFKIADGMNYGQETWKGGVSNSKRVESKIHQRKNTDSVVDGTRLKPICVSIFV